MPVSPAPIPRVGMLATLRNRHGVVTSVEPYDAGAAGRVHLTTVEYTDSEGRAEDRVLWEVEPGTSLLEPTALPDPEAAPPMRGDDFDALVRATRWGALIPFIDPDGQSGPLSRLPIASPLHGAIQAEDYQLIPLLKALRMPRVSLLIADDVGLGKTIEAGLILSELLIRRRVRRVLILCPASLRTQWRDEMREKFALHFDEIDRAATFDLRKRLGMDANPWRVFPRAIASYHYIKQHDVLEQFLAASRAPGESPSLPWDLLIVDEAHNLAPAPFGEESDLSKLLGVISPLFEHKIFLTATPHNGHTRSFSGLLERLDPVRFTRTNELSAAERQRVDQVLVRRLKREINERSPVKRFAERHLAGVPVVFATGERSLAAAVGAFRDRIRSLVAQEHRHEQVAGTFAVEIFGKRLLSCPTTFADTWYRTLEGMENIARVEAGEVRAAERVVEEETADDREIEGRLGHAATMVGAWLNRFADRVTGEAAAVSAALGGLGLSRGMTPETARPAEDVRWDALVTLIERRLRTGDSWRDDERIVVFTEYKTTLDYLTSRLRERYGADGAIRTLFGGMDDYEREAIKAAFNDSTDPVRVLVATDAASEGLNLQETARYLLHFDVPWNPARLEQRNGRLDRHGQARDVEVFHFTSDDDADLAFLARVVVKVDTIREELGSTGDLFDQAFQSRFLRGREGAVVLDQLDVAIHKTRGLADVPRDDTASSADEADQIEALKRELDLDPEALRETMDVALGMDAGRPRVSQPDGEGRCVLVPPVPSSWNGIVDDSLRLRSGHAAGAMPKLVFDPIRFVHYVNGRPVFRPARGAALMHLAHPVYRRVITTFARSRFDTARDGGAARLTRWTVRYGDVPTGADALLLLTLEEMAGNELRETFHHWVRTICLPIVGESLGDPLPHRPAITLRAPRDTPTAGAVSRARNIWAAVERDVKRFVKEEAARLSAALGSALEAERDAERVREVERFRSRQGELSALMEQQTIQRLEREIAEHQAWQAQTSLDLGAATSETVSVEDLEEELRRRSEHFGRLRELLDQERERVLQRILPRRFALRGDAHVFPVAVEIRLPEAVR